MAAADPVHRPTAPYRSVIVLTDGRRRPMASRAVAHRLAGRWGIEFRQVEVDQDEVGDALARLPDALVVVDSHGHSRRGGIVADLAEAAVLAAPGPVLMAGPRVTIASDWPSGPLLICSDGTPFSDAIVEPAARWARWLDVEPRLLMVTEGAPVAAFVDAASGHAASGARSLHQVTASVESVVGRPVHHDLLHGDDPAGVIVDHADWSGACLIAVTTHGRAGLARLAKGSVTMSVLRRATCPVLVLGPSGNG